MKKSSDGGFILLDAVISVFILSIGFISAVYGLSVFLKAAGKLDETVTVFSALENRRTDTWFSIPAPP